MAVWKAKAWIPSKRRRKNAWLQVVMGGKGIATLRRFDLLGRSIFDPIEDSQIPAFMHRGRET
jgi:hypothetical protein